MALTNAQMTGLEAAILAYLAAGGRFARTVAAFKEEMQVENDPLVVRQVGHLMEEAAVEVRQL